MQKIIFTIIVLSLFTGGICAQIPAKDSIITAGSNIRVEIKWKYESKSLITSTPIYSDGTIYLGAGGSLLAVDTTGKKLFTFKTKGPVKGKPAVTDSKIYFQSGDGFLYCIDKSGKEIWKLQLDSLAYLQLYDMWDFYHSSPVISGNILYCGSSSTNFFAIDAENGKVLWKYKTGHIIRSTPVVNSSIVFFGGFDGYFYALDAASGKEIWKYKIPQPNYSRCGEIQSSAAVSGGKVIFGSRDGMVHALDLKTGKEIWSNNHEGSWVIATPVITDSLVITASSDAHFVNAVNVNSGKELWRYNTRFNVFATPVVSSGKVYCGEGNAYSFFEDAYFFELDQKTGKELWRLKTDGQVWSSPITAGGTIYFATYAGTIYAVSVVY
jgi:outer membrane protein assembly factor BamB